MKTLGNSDIGRIRQNNEDAFRFGCFDDGVTWAVVCDGMGGAAGGQIASSIAADMVGKKIEKCYNKSMTEGSIENMLLSAITTANVTVYDRAIADDFLSGMGTTLVAAVIKNSVASIAHVGDSRAYLIHDGTLRLLTKDHSLVQEMLDNGQITQEEFEHHPVKNIITRALGVAEQIEIEFDTAELVKGDVLFLCTDGLSGTVSGDEMLQIYREYSFDQFTSKLIERANSAGGKDNITVVAVQA
ncbi:MAG: Stp1/IreP family PP2C-type Ser/Thr phosphatase [Clostridia bacterium]|nr:Stp1/IreP family PP2C-type Ser/Thr phosphatase [Clostridia bacterium]MBQ4364793.1 Stp1/IreP family PP2C-type Ser/Thr phosphatase [Clostridia bacterium]MBQ6092156.1 Stp1/IreP family PP2C-type Ser/Thr phosphatase [Clostridia bacterium]MBR3096113.1 Stp1/IreP family PP2C-type Ser/Thr phosphatase [Clostridia bacterium]